MTPLSSFITLMTPIRIRNAVVIVALLFTIGTCVRAQEQSKAVGSSEYERLKADAAFAAFDRRDATSAEREAALRRMVTLDAVGARIRLKAALATDPTRQVREAAGRWLAVLGDRTGLDEQRRVLTQTPRVDGAAVAARLLGSRGIADDAPSIAAAVKPAAQALFTERSPALSPEDRSVLKYGVIALGRIGRPEDRGLIIDVVAQMRSTDFAEALGYVADGRAKSLLWELHHESAVPNPRCDQRGLAVPVLLALSRAGDESAANQVSRILKGELGPKSIAGDVSVLCGDREQAFQLLRNRDASLFGETVVEIAGEEPEGPWTYAAWRALGVMHPPTLANRLLALAVSKRPHWRQVTRDVLNKVVMAANPDLNERFWSYFEASPIPQMRAERSLIESGAGHLLFSGTEPWTGD